ncbi:MAG: ribonuclease R [Kiloniellales bacterium]
MARRLRSTPPFPRKADILAFIRDADKPVDRKEIARAFNIRGEGRSRLRALLKELEEEGELERNGKRRVAPPGRLPEVVVAEISGTDADGELLARPAIWKHEDLPPPVIYMAPERRGRPALGSGDRALVRLRQLDSGHYEGRVIRVLGGAPRRVMGIYEIGDEGGRLRPTDKRARTDFVLEAEDAAGAKPGELVLAEVKPHHPRLGLREVTVVERLGHLGEVRALSLIAIHEHGLPTDFTGAALAEAEAAGPVDAASTMASATHPKTDLRDLPLVTIDGADARDFDDAVWAEPDGDGGNPGGWHAVVAIADVAHYVRPGSALDRAAFDRGNSVYFPDRVVPMLPEALSNGWCSLKPAEERPCLAVHLWLDAEGKLLRHRFERGLMRSAARLTYEQVQAARDDRPDDVTQPLLETVITPLYGAFAALLRARQARGTLDLDLPERRVVFAADGSVAGIEPRWRLDSHRLIEELMITANVAAAETLEARRQPCMYRVHDAPDPQKLEALREVLRSFGLSLARGQVVKPRAFGQILDKVAGQPHAPMVSELVLRAQSQAAYAPRNIGHYGLALRRYAHFTSPIRRYSDLLVHRALISGLGLGEGGLPEGAGARFEEIGLHISATERRAQAAERDAMDRFAAAYLSDRIGAVFEGRITGVTRFGLFVTLHDSGADGLVPMSLLPDDYYQHDEARHCLTGRRWGRQYRLGDSVRARLIEAEPASGGLVLQLAEETTKDRAASEETTGPEPTAGWDPLRDFAGQGRSAARRSAGVRRSARRATRQSSGDRSRRPR